MKAKLLLIVLFLVAFHSAVYATSNDMLVVAPHGGLIGLGETYAFNAQILTANGDAILPEEEIEWIVNEPHAIGTGFFGNDGVLSIDQNETCAYVLIEVRAKSTSGEILTATSHVYIRENQPQQKEPLIAGMPTIDLDNDSPSSLRIRVKLPKGAEGCDIYFCASGDKEFQLITSIGSQDPSKVISGFECGKSYYFKGIPFAYIGGEKVTGMHSEVVSVKARPSSPLSIKADPLVKAVKLSWETVDDCDGYAIYRSSSRTGPYVLIRTMSGKNSKAYVDTGLDSEASFFYKIVSYKKVGDLKVPSAFAGPAAVAAK